MLNTSFVHDNVLRLLKSDIDFTSNVEVSDRFFLDVIFKEVKEQTTATGGKAPEAKLDYIVAECRRKIEEKPQD